MNKNLLENLKKDIKELEDNVFAILIYGSHVTGKAHQRSDIDVCVVSKTKNKEKIKSIFRQILRVSAKNEEYDIRIFELMPLFMRMEVIEKGEVIYTKSLSRLNEYFYFFRKLWQDQSVSRIIKFK